MDDRGHLVLLPAADYPATAPLFWYTALVGRGQGWSVVTCEDGAADPAGSLRRVLERLAGRVVVVTKSGSSRAAGVAAERSLPGVWFTPLLSDPEVADPLRRLDAPSLVVGAPSDPDWRVEVAASMRRAEVLQLTDADPNLEVPDDPARTVELLGRVLGRVADLLRRVR
jgi:hypothetical protein